MAEKQSARADSAPTDGMLEPRALLTRRELLGVAGLAGVTALAGRASAAVPQDVPGRPRIACLASLVLRDRMRTGLSPS
jgi:hypothetical protein